MAGAETRLTDLDALNDPDLDAVLVNSARISQLQAAYPHYYADTEAAGPVTDIPGPDPGHC
jgi:hypothetical protein